MKQESMIRNLLDRANEYRARRERRPVIAMPTLEQVEIAHIERVLRETDGNVTHAAEVLGIDRRTLYRKMVRCAEQHGVAR